MATVIMLSGPIGAGKTTVARELVRLWPAPLAYIEGDVFWRFLVKAGNRDRRENFRIIARSMTAAASPLARAGYEVLLDFSIPPEFLKTARVILKELPLDFVMLRPSWEVCRTRLTVREGPKPDYALYQEFYAMFAGMDAHAIEDDAAETAELADEIARGVKAGRFRIPAP